MKSNKLTCLMLLALFATVAIPDRLAGQEQTDNKDPKPEHRRYKLVDLGTFGGPTSYLSINGPGLPILNDSGVVTSFADTSIRDPNAPTSCYNPDCFLSHAFRWQDGVKTDIGALPGVNSSAAGPINERGWSVGQSQNGVIDPLLGTPEIRATLWKDGRIIDLGTLGGNESLASTVNNKGQVVGAAANTIPDPFSLFGFGTQTRAFLWQNGEIRDLGTLGGPDAAPAALNEREQVAGFSYTNATPNPVTGVPTTDPFLWDRGTMIDLGTLGGTNSLVGSLTLVLNDRGQVAGTSDLTGDIDAHAFLWDRGTLTDLGTLGGTFSTTFWLNDEGDVVGAATTATEFLHAALWRKGVITDLGTLDGDCFSLASAINSNRQIVGQSFSCDFSTVRAVLWENGSIIDLNTVIPANSGLFLVDGFNINNRGEILGQGFPPGVQNGDFGGHDFLLIPCEQDEMDSNSCSGNDDAERNTTNRGKATYTSQVQPPAAQPNLTPSEMKDRVRAILINRNRGFRGFPPK
jgi:probable HAF family extracellular repeat protein